MSKILYEIDCADQTIQNLVNYDYNANGIVLSSSNTPTAPERIIPETVGSAIYDEICKIKS
jgi:hypothetical protein